MEKTSKEIIGAHPGKKWTRWELLVELEASGLRDAHDVPISEDNRAFKRVWQRLPRELKHAGRPPNVDTASRPSQKAGQ